MPFADQTCSGSPENIAISEQGRGMSSCEKIDKLRPYAHTLYECDRNNVVEEIERLLRLHRLEDITEVEFEKVALSFLGSSEWQLAYDIALEILEDKNKGVQNVHYAAAY